MRGWETRYARGVEILFVVHASDFHKAEIHGINLVGECYVHGIIRAR